LGSKRTKKKKNNQTKEKGPAEDPKGGLEGDVVKEQIKIQARLNLDNLAMEMSISAGNFEEKLSQNNVQRSFLKKWKRNRREVRENIIAVDATIRALWKNES